MLRGASSVDGQHASSFVLQDVAASSQIGSELGKASGFRSIKLVDSDVDADDVSADLAISANLRSVNVSPLPSLKLCSHSPALPAREGFGSEAFVRRLPKLSDVREDMDFGSKMSDAVGFDSAFPATFNSLNMSSFPASNLCSLAPCSSPEKGSPRIFNGNWVENFGAKKFLRSLSKLGAGSEDVLFDMEGFGLENGGLSAYENLASSVGSPVISDSLGALQKFLPSNNEEGDGWPSVDSYACDEFRMYEFKVRRCMRGKSHDWTECPFAHPGEKARRRDPRKFHYSGSSCPDFKKGSCKRGDACEFAHGVFECWLHPARYRTQPCKDGRNCKRRVCFFAHVPEQLRVLPGPTTSSVGSSSPRSSFSSASKSSLSGSYDGSPLRQALAGSVDGGLCLDNCTSLRILDGTTIDGLVGSPRSYVGLVNLKKSGLGYTPYCQIASPTSTLAGLTSSPPHLSPPLSPAGSPQSYLGSLNSSSVSNMVQVSAFPPSQASSPSCFSTSAMPMHGPSPFSSVIPGHRRHLDRLGSLPCLSLPLESDEDTELAKSGFISPGRWPSPKPSFFHTPQTLLGAPSSPEWLGQQISSWDVKVPVHRVESGRDLRAKIYGKLCKESLPESDVPDLGWVNELVESV